MDRIELTGMSFQGRHGVSAGERERPQEFRVDVEIEVDLTRASRTDDLAETIDYRRVREAARDIVGGPPMKLIESLAGAIADRILEMPEVASVSVRVAKRPPSMQPIEAAAVRINRTRA